MSAPEAVGDRAGLGLVLSGGAARALTHLGVAAALAEHGIEPSAFAGSSGGAVVAAGLACGISPEALAHEACRLSLRRLARFSFSRRALFDIDRLASFISQIIPARDFDQLRVPLSVVATDLDTGERVVFDHGPLIPALVASCAIPGIFAPARVAGRLLVDGGVSCNVPSDIIRNKPVRAVVAVDATADAHAVGSANLVRVIVQSIYLMSRRLAARDLADADLVVAPEMAGIGWEAFGKAPQIIAAGRVAMEAKIPELLEILGAAERSSPATPQERK